MAHVADIAAGAAIDIIADIDLIVVVDDVVVVLVTGASRVSAFSKRNSRSFQWKHSFSSFVHGLWFQLRRSSLVNVNDPAGGGGGEGITIGKEQFLQIDERR